jgi:hypothetical protein
MTTRDTGIALPGDKAYEIATSVFNLAAPPRPVAAMTARTLDQIRAAIRYAKTRNLGVRTHATGHGSAGVRPMDQAVLIRTQLDGGVELDVARRLARVPAGSRWAEVIDAAARHELAAAHGSSPLTGVVGYLLRGGVSFYGRLTGLGVNWVRAIELVTADGELRRVDATSDPELFWALRGGGGGFGVVTAVEIELFPMAKVITGATYWPAVHAGRLMRAWMRWTMDAPREMTTSLRVMNLPKVPEVPDILSRGTVLCVDGSAAVPSGDPSAARQYVEDLLAPLRSLAEPLLDTWHLAAPPAVAQTHMDPTEPFPIYGDHMLLGEISEECAAEFVRLTGPDSGSPLTNAELRQLGGALSAPHLAGGVLNHLDARFAYMGGGVPFGPVTPEAISQRCALLRAALTRWDAGRTAPTFVESPDQPQRHLSKQQVRAVDGVRARVDPAHLFSTDISPNATELGYIHGHGGRASADQGRGVVN